MGGQSFRKSLPIGLGVYGWMTWRYIEGMQKK